MASTSAARKPATWSEAPRTDARSTRNRQIVEGALLGDVAVVLLLGRIYLPIPIVRTIWRLLAAGPFVLLAQRQGIRVTIMSAVVSYLLMTALVGPTLALTALDTAFAAIIIAAALRWRWPRPVIALIGGLIYGALDIVLPTIVLTVLFRIPVATLVGDFRTAIRGAVRVGAQMMETVNSMLRGVFGPRAPQFPAAGFRGFGYDLTAFVVGHWLTFALIAAAVMGMANIYAYHTAANLVLDRLPSSARMKQAPA